MEWWYIGHFKCVAKFQEFLNSALDRPIVSFMSWPLHNHPFQLILNARLKMTSWNQNILRVRR